MNKKIILWIFVLILLASFVTSAPPPFAQTGTFTEGLEIKFPPITGLPINENATFDFHVFNISNGMPMTENEGVVCYFHLYSPALAHSYVNSSNRTTKDFDYEFVIDHINFTGYGQHSYMIQCNNSKLGGFESVIFTVSNSGEELTVANSITYLGFLFIVLFFMIVCLYFGIVIDGKDEIEFGIIQKINVYKHVKTFLYLISYLFFILLTYFLWAISKTFLFGISPSIFKMLFTLAWIGVFPIFILLLVKLMVDLITNKELLKFTERGLKTRPKGRGKA